jgi:hypothetical protein
LFDFEVGCKSKKKRSFSSSIHVLFLLPPRRRLPLSRRRRKLDTEKEMEDIGFQG